MAQSTLLNPSISRQRTVMWPFVGLLGAVILLLGIFGAVRAIGDLEAMAADVHRMSDRLQTLDAMNAKLGQLNTMSSNLSSMQARLDLTVGQLKQANALLITTNGKLDVANNEIKDMVGTTRAMSRQLQSVGAMRADMDELTHKLSGSFLFRGVK
jgi:methyl-accepting chemotaxis protein